MADFLDLVRSEHQRQQEIQKSHGRVVRPPEQIDESPFVPAVMEGLRRRFAAKPPVSKELKVIKGRKTTFEDLLRGRAAGYHAVRSDRDFPSDWDSDELSDIVTDFFEALEDLSV